LPVRKNPFEGPLSTHNVNGTIEEGKRQDLEGRVFQDEISDWSCKSQDQHERDDNSGNDDPDLIGQSDGRDDGINGKYYIQKDDSRDNGKKISRVARSLSRHPSTLWCDGFR